MENASPRILKIQFARKFVKINEVNDIQVAIIGRTEMLFNTALELRRAGCRIPLIVTAKEAPEYTKTAEDFEVLANNIGATFLNTGRISASDSVAKLRELGDLDIGVSINYPTILSSEVIDLFRLGIVNLHGGDLPRYRGNACQAWAILNGESRIGLCLHKMIGGELDTGAIISREYFPIDIYTRIGEVLGWIAATAPHMITQAVATLNDNPEFVLEAMPNENNGSLRCYPRLPEDGRIDWNDSNEKILRLVNASSEPYSGAFCEFDGKRMTIWRAGLVSDDENYLAVTGQVAAISEEGHVTVICGDGKLRIKEVQVDNFRGAPNSVIKSTRSRLK